MKRSIGLAACLVLLTALAAHQAEAQVADPCDVPSWVAAWALPLSDATVAYQDQTVRVVVRPNFGGDEVRVRLSNEFGEQPVTLTNAHVAHVEQDATLVPGTSIPLTFGGLSAVTVQPGASITSDAASLNVTAFEEIAVSYYAPGATGPASGYTPSIMTARNVLGATTWVASSDHATDESGTAFGSPTPGSRFVTAVDVFAPNDGLIVGFGDSITEGWSSEAFTLQEVPAWTDTLAHRLHDLAISGGPRLSVVNTGISGNKILVDGRGPSAVNRLDRDVLAQSGVVGVILLEGINDLCNPCIITPAPGPPPTVEEMAVGYSSIIGRIEAENAKIWISPLTPAGDQRRPTPFGHSATPEQVRLRHEVNRWIRGGTGASAYDGRIDFDSVVLDPLNPNWLAPEYDSGDNLHPNPDGQAAMGASIDLSVFDRFACLPEPSFAPSLGAMLAMLAMLRRRLGVAHRVDARLSCSQRTGPTAKANAIGGAWDQNEPTSRFAEG